MSNRYQNKGYSLYILGNQVYAEKCGFFMIDRFLEKGVSMLEDMDIPFSFVLRHTKSKRFLLVSDCFATAPVYYTDPVLENMVVADSVKNIQSQCPELTELNPRYIADYLTYHTANQEESIYQGVFKLPAAHYLYVTDDGELVLKEYWNGIDKKNQQHQPFVKEDLPNLVQTQFESDPVKQVGVELSGGLDSSTLAMLLPAGKEKIEVFSNVEKSGEEEKIIAKTVKKLPYAYTHHKLYATMPYRFVTKIHDIFRAEKKPPFGSYGVFAEPLLSAAQQAKVKTLYSGFGGDQVLSWHANGYLVSLRQERKWLTLLMIALKSGLGSAIKKLLVSFPFFYHFDFINKVAEKKSNVKYSRSFIVRVFSNNIYQQEKIREVHKTMLCNFYEHKFFLAVRMGHVAKSVESRSTEAAKYGIQYVFTFLHRALFSFSANVPMAWHYDGKTSRKLIKDAMRDKLDASVCEVEVKQIDAIPGVKHNLFVHQSDYLAGRLESLAQHKIVLDYIDVEKLKKNLQYGAEQPGLRFFVHAWMMAEFLVWWQGEYNG